MIEHIIDFDRFNVPESYCRHCDYSEYEHDPCGTGDSESGYVCNVVNTFDCLFMQEHEIDLDAITDVVINDVYAEDAPKFESAYIASAKHLCEPIDKMRLDYINDNCREFVILTALNRLTERF